MERENQLGSNSNHGQRKGKKSKLNKVESQCLAHHGFSINRTLNYMLNVLKSIITFHREINTIQNRRFRASGTAGNLSTPLVRMPP